MVAKTSKWVQKYSHFSGTTQDTHPGRIGINMNMNMNMNTNSTMLTVDGILEEEDLIPIRGLFREATYYMKDDAFDRATVVDNYNASCAQLFDFLVIASIIREVMEYLLQTEISRMIDAARANNLDSSTIVNGRGTNTCMVGKIQIDKGKVIDDAIEVHKDISRRYSRVNATIDRLTKSEERVLHGFRKASLSVAIRVAFLTHLAQTTKEFIIQTFVEEYNTPISTVPVVSPPTTPTTTQSAAAKGVESPTPIMMHSPTSVIIPSNPPRRSADAPSPTSHSQTSRPSAITTTSSPGTINVSTTRRPPCNMSGANLPIVKYSPWKIEKGMGKLLRKIAFDVGMEIGKMILCMCFGIVV